MKSFFFLFTLSSVCSSFIVVKTKDTRATISPILCVSLTISTVLGCWALEKLCLNV
jgi:hypothetical protein